MDYPCGKFGDCSFSRFGFYRASAYLLLTRDIDIAILSVRPSIRPSVRNTLVLYENGLTYRHNFSTIR